MYGLTGDGILFVYDLTGAGISFAYKIMTLLRTGYHSCMTLQVTESH